MSFSYTLEKGVLRIDIRDINTKVYRAAIVFDCNAGGYKIEGDKNATPAAMGKAMWEQFRFYDGRVILDKCPLLKSMDGFLRANRSFGRAVDTLGKVVPFMEKLSALGLTVANAEYLATDEYQEKIRNIHFTKEVVEKIKQYYGGVVSPAVIDQLDDLNGLPDDVIARYGKLIGTDNPAHAAKDIQNHKYNIRTIQWILYLAENKQFANFPDFLRDIGSYINLLSVLKEENTFPKNFYEDYARLLGIRRAKDEQIKEEKRAALRGKLFYENDLFTVIIPVTNEEFAREGRDQHNCVHGYAGAAMRGDYHIVFIRKKDSPMVSFVTCQIDKRGRRAQTTLAYNRTNFDTDTQRFLKEYDKFLEKSFR